MIKAVVLCHPSSKSLLNTNCISNKLVKPIRISCGTTKINNVHYSEANDFFPTYASLNSALFETSVILTVWEHADQLIGENHVAILHTDITPSISPKQIWQNVINSISENDTNIIGMTMPQHYNGMIDDWIVPDTIKLNAKNDPMLLTAFDNNIHIWQFIKKYDYEIYQWCMDTDPRMIYSHQFACSRIIFDKLGEKLLDIVNRLKLSDIGLWTPHMFERLIALYLAKFGNPIITKSFWHFSSSGAFGPGQHNLYGPRGRKYYNICSRNITNKK